MDDYEPDIKSVVVSCDRQNGACTAVETVMVRGNGTRVISGVWIKIKIDFSKIITTKVKMELKCQKIQIVLEQGVRGMMVKAALQSERTVEEGNPGRPKIGIKFKRST